MSTFEMIKKTKAAWPHVRDIGEAKKNKLLRAMAEELEAETETILSCNREDIADAKPKMSAVMLDRLMLNAERIHQMAEGIRAIAELEDHTGRILDRTERPNGMIITKKQVPLGLVAIIYESRPNVTSDAAALALKSGNVCILRGGKEAFRSANAIVNALKKGIEKAGGCPEIINLLQDTTRESANELMRAADLQKALRIIINAKTSRPSVCNAEEVCLVHKDIASTFLPMLKQALVDDRRKEGLVPVELRLDQRAAGIIAGTPAGAHDFDTEFLDYILAVGVVDDVHAAVAHILKHSTGHSEAIITENREHAEIFTMQTDSAAVYVNVSTRFTDGGEFGLGCEMGISTQKLHARGPMGLDALSTYKYIITGDGQIR